VREAECDGTTWGRPDERRGGDPPGLRRCCVPVVPAASGRRRLAV